MKQEFNIAGAIVVAGILIAGAIYLRPLSQPTEIASDQPDQAAALAAAVLPTTNDHVRGSNDPEIILIEYSDLECPFCKVQHENLVAALPEYADRVQWVHRHFPLNIHQKARPEALASECAAEIAGNEGFWAFVDLIFEVTPSNDGLDLATLPDLAEQVGIDRLAFEQCLETAEEVHGPTIDAHLNEALLTGGNGTPWNILIDSEGNRYPIEGALTAEGIKMVFDDLLDE